jgi:aspartyl/asparaginyl beta-hydroxylase (cupin superfamily)
MKTILKNLVLLYFKFLYKCAGGENRQVFYDIEKTAPALRNLEKNYSIIKNEVERLLESKRNLPSYHDLDPKQFAISAGGNKKWKVFLLYAMGAKPKANRALCPQTSALLDKIPNLFEAFFSILEAGKSVPAHNNSYCGMLRYHLGLIVPSENPPRIRIKDQFYTWREGESVLFDDCWEHEVFNESKGDRVVLLVDVLRPLPLPVHILNLLFVKGMRFGYASGLRKNMAKFH